MVAVPDADTEGMWVAGEEFNAIAARSGAGRDENCYSS
jgi:hypothetical protein